RSVAGVRQGEVRWVRLTGASAGQRHAAAGLSPVDFIFIDGDHSYDGLRQDWEAWRTLIAPGGIVALHDSRSTASRPLDRVGDVVYVRDVILRDPVLPFVAA